MPSTFRTSRATEVENGVPITFDTMNCDVTAFSRALSVLAEAEAPRIDISETRARPSMRADAVAAVRRGLRLEFWAASWPTVPKARRYAAPSSSTRGRPMIGLIKETPTRMESIPMPISHSSKSVSPTKPQTMRPIPTTTMAEPRISRLCREVSGRATSSRIAATGGIRDARRAGR